MQTLIKRTTQSSQLADEIERKIRTGELTPGFKMSSIREIGSAYNVSVQVVNSAIMILERKGLVVCEPRIGIYVNPKALTPRRMNLAVLHVRDTGGGQNYLDQLLAFSAPCLWADYCISRHQVPERTEELAYEVEKISNARPDCLLVFLPSLKAKGLAVFKKLHFPVIFIGDFHDGILPGIANQIVEDTGERAISFVNCAWEHNLRDVVMIGPLEQHYYIKLFVEVGAARAKELGIRFRYYPFRDPECRSEEIFCAVRARTISSIISQGAPDGLLLEGRSRTDLYIEALRRNRLRVPEDVKIITSYEVHPGTTYVKYDCSAFGQKVQSLIEGLIANPSQAIGRQVLSGLIEANFLKISSWRCENIRNRQSADIQS